MQSALSAVSSIDASPEHYPYYSESPIVERLAIKFADKTKNNSLREVFGHSTSASGLSDLEPLFQRRRSRIGYASPSYMHFINLIDGPD